jgi:hypothetical protein
VILTTSLTAHERTVDVPWQKYTSVAASVGLGVGADVGEDVGDGVGLTVGAAVVGGSSLIAMYDARPATPKPSTCPTTAHVSKTIY